jgi:drug/metabolite transporter (DMT)-like permease
MNRDQTLGVTVMLISCLCAGLAPIFGKLAYRADVTPYTLVAGRTLLAALMLWGVYALFWRKYIPISRKNLFGCISMGIANGLGSLLYYTGLARIDASLAQLLYVLYPVWVFIFLSAAGHPISRLALARLGLAMVGVTLLTQLGGGGQVDILGALLLVGAPPRPGAAPGPAYGWHLVLGQWTLADVDPRTTTLYVLTTMAVVVVTARFFVGGSLEPISQQGFLAMLALAIFPTALARLFLFIGVRFLGSVQASLLGVAELVVAVAAAILFLGERMTLLQSIGALAVVVAVLLIGRDSALELEEWEEWLFSPQRTTPRPPPSKEDQKITAPMKIIAKSDLPRPKAYGIPQGRKAVKSQRVIPKKDSASATHTPS